MNVIRNIAILGTTGAAALLLSGCYTPSSSGSVYSAGEARNEQTVRMGVVESVRQVTIEGTKGELGTVAGGAIGGLGGSTLGGGSRGGAVGTIVGAVAGGIAGSAIERNVTQKKGLEITVKLDNGELRAITQEADVDFRPGQRVRLVSSRGVTRVTP
jgi:outer membrane lipoprotein SlyB